MDPNPDPAAVALYVRPSFRGERPLAYRKRFERETDGAEKMIEIFVFRHQVVAHCPATGRVIAAPWFIENDRWLYPIVYIEGVDDCSLLPLLSR